MSPIKKLNTPTNKFIKTVSAFKLDSFTSPSSTKQI